MPTSADFAQQQLYVFKKWANIGLFPVYFRPFLITTSTIQIENSLDGVIGIRTRGCRMVGANDTMELWRPQLDVCTLTLRLHKGTFRRGQIMKLETYKRPLAGNL